MTTWYSKWTSLYYGNDEADAHKLKPCIRLTPEFMELEDAGFPHGLPLAVFFENEAAAIAFAEQVDAFMEAMVAAIKDGDYPISD